MISREPVYLTLPQRHRRVLWRLKITSFSSGHVALQTKCIKGMAWKWTLMCDKMSLFMSLTDVLLDTFSALRKNTCCLGDDNIWSEHSGLDMEKCHLSSWEDVRVGRLVRRQSCVDEICGTVDFLMFVTFVIPPKPFNNHCLRIQSFLFCYIWTSFWGHHLLHSRWPSPYESKGPKREQKAYNFESQNEMFGIKHLAFKAKRKKVASGWQSITFKGKGIHGVKRSKEGTHCKENPTVCQSHWLSKDTDIKSQ